VRSPYSYNVELSDGSRHELPANKIQPFIGRVQDVGIIRDQDVDFGEVEHAPVGVDMGPTVAPSDQN